MKTIEYKGVALTPIPTLFESNSGPITKYLFTAVVNGRTLRGYEEDVKREIDRLLPEAGK
jgi:hypothetical protein